MNNILDNICGYKLDEYQKKAITDDHKSLLLLAGAGSGKTLTIIGKIRYLIEEKKLKQKEIICLSLTNYAVDNLKNKLKKEYNYDIEVLTFHKLAKKIITKDYMIDNNILKYIVHEYLFYMIKTNTYLEKIVLKYFNYQSELRTTKKYDNFIKYHKDKLYILENIIINFINLYKTNYKDYSYINNIYKNINRKNKKMIILIYKIMKIYEEELVSEKKLDLNDLLIKALKTVKKSNNLNYKYIIIDEYQDTSHIKYELIKEIIYKTKARLFAVGDDYQTIFSFTGCDINLFLDFNKCFNDTITMTLPNIYRNSKELVEVAKQFIMKNKYQLNKNLMSKKTIEKPIKIVYIKDINKDITTLINKVNTKILVLGRNNIDLENIDVENKMTIHKSKGLEEENVIIINNKNDILGFPSKIKENNIIKYVLTKQKIKYEEERRLFYVALTRTKNSVYLLVYKNNKSTFIKELLKNYKKNIEIMKI